MGEIGGLSVGSTLRRYIPEGGLEKHNAKIRRESKLANDHKNLPFTLSKPPRRVGSAWFACVECGRTLSASKNTVMYVCPDCKKLTKVEVLE